MRKMQKWLAVLGICLMTAVVPAGTAYAETEPTYEATEVTSMAEAYVGKVIKTDQLNVRTGFGVEYDRVMVNGQHVVLNGGDEIAIMSSGISASGDVWYEVRWVENGVEYHGYVNSYYIEKSENRAVPLPTPTPIATPTPEPTPTPVATPTPIATPTPVATPTPISEPNEDGGFSVWHGIGIVLLLLITAAVVYVILVMKKREAAGAETSEKIDNLKNIQIRKGPEDTSGNPISVMKRKQEVTEDVRETSSFRSLSRGYASDAEMLAKKEHARMVNAEIMEKSRFYDPNEEKKKEDELKQLSESLKEKELLREEIDNLGPGDLVYHEYFGKGVVFDNSDVKRIEIRFGTDVRYIDKAGCVAKKLMRKV